MSSRWRAKHPCAFAVTDIRSFCVPWDIVLIYDSSYGSRDLVFHSSAVSQLPPVGVLLCAVDLDCIWGASNIRTHALNRCIDTEEGSAQRQAAIVEVMQFVHLHKTSRLNTVLQFTTTALAHQSTLWRLTETRSLQGSGCAKQDKEELPRHASQHQFVTCTFWQDTLALCVMPPSCLSRGAHPARRTNTPQYWGAGVQPELLSYDSTHKGNEACM